MVTATYQIQEGAPTGYEARGGAAQLWRYKGPEVILSGPAETGKTRAALEKLDALMWKYPGAQAAIVRKTRESMTGSVLVTYERKVLGQGSPVRIYGGQHAEWYDYPNGSRVYVGGIDKPGKILSSERDVLYVNQAEELGLDDWETLTTRATGRAGNMPYAQVMADCNPGSNTHWIRGRAGTGRLQMFESRHEDNPVLWDAAREEWTEQGRRTLSVLDSLTGVRYKRLRLGLWVAAEGMIWDGYDPKVHIIDPEELPELFDDDGKPTGERGIPRQWDRLRVIDFGYTNPFCCQWWAIDPDGRMYMYRELYGTQKLVEDWGEQINELSEGETYVDTVADHDAEDRATLRRKGIYTTAARKDVAVGLQAVAVRLRKAGDGKPRIFFVRGSLVDGQRDQSLLARHKPTCTTEEIEGYVWERGLDGKPLKEVPHKEDDHGCDTTRYAVQYVDARGQVVDYSHEGGLFA